MLSNPFKCNNRQKCFRTQKNEKHRALRIENLEKREMLSAVGITNNNLYEDLTGYYSFENGIPEENCVVFGESEVLFSETLNSNVLSLDGDGDFVNLGNPAEMNFDGEITLSAWVKAEATNGIRNIITHGHTTNPKAEVFLRINNGYFEIGSWDGTNHQARTQILASDVGAWVHIAGTYDGTDWKLYRNGTEVASVTDSVGALQVNDNWYIGADGTRGERFFDGMLDNVTLHNQALSATQIQELAQKTHRGTICHYSCSYNEENLLLDDENALHGIFEGDAEIRTDLDYGDYLSLNGSNSYVNLQNEEILNFSGEITLAAWVKPEATNGTQNIIAHGYTRNPNKEVSLRIINGQYQVGAWNGADYYATASIPSEDVGTWVHIAGTYDGTTWHLYRNGVEIASQTASVGAMPLNSNWCIGASGSGTERFYRGGIDEVIIADKALSVTEIEELAAPREILMPTPVASWDCESNNVGTLLDSVGELNGTLVNGAKFVADEDRYSVLDLSDNDGYVELGNPEELQITGEITLSAWVNPNSTEGIQNIITKGFTKNPNGEVYLRIANGQYQVGSWNGQDHRTQVDIPAEDIGSWVHLIGTYDGTSWRLYRNGELVSSTVDSVGAVAVVADWTIGAYVAGTTVDRTFNGKISDVLLLDTGISVAQSKKLFDNQSKTPISSENPPHVRVGGDSYVEAKTAYVLNLNTLKYDGIKWTVNWGDGEISTPRTVNDITPAIHEYQTAGTYTIKVRAISKTENSIENAKVFGGDFTVTVYEEKELIVNGDFESTQIPTGQSWWIFDQIEGWTSSDGAIEIQAGQMVELDSDTHQANADHGDRSDCGCRTSITSNSFDLLPGISYTLTFDSWNRSEYAEDNMVDVTVPGTITHINGLPISQYGSDLTTNINTKNIDNKDDQFALMFLNGNKITFSAGGNTYRYVNSENALSETTGVTPFKVTSITFVPNQTIGTVTFSDASTDDVKPSYGPFLDNVSLKSICVYADLRLDSGNDGKRMDSANSNKIDSFDNTMEDEAIGYVLEMGTSGDVEINFGISTGWPTDDLFIRLVEAVENEEDRILDFVEFDVPLSEFSSGGLWEITAKALPKSQTTQLRLEIYTTINGEELILSEDTATVTVSLFEMREIVKNKAGNGVYGRVVNFGQPLLPSDDRSHMWTSDLTTETHQTPRNGGDDGESYLKSALSYENGFDMECQYAFLHEEDGYGDQYGYVQAVDKDRANPLKKKYSFVANGGIKFGSIGGAGDSVFEATLLDVQAMIDKAMAELGMQSLDSSIVVNGNLRVPLTGYENSESINRLLNGIAYGQPLENIFIDDALCGTDAYSYLLRAYEYASYFGTSGSMRIITTGADTSENSWTYGDISIITNGMQTYNSDPWNEETVLPLPVRNQQNEDGKPILNNNQKPIKEKYFDSRIYLQSHWGSGVRYTAITIEDNPEGGE